MTELYIGLMSGTSADGIDTALVDLSTNSPQLLAKLFTPYTAQMRNDIIALCASGENEIARLGSLDIQLAKAFAKSVNDLLSEQGLKAADIQAIGSHGQTIRHMPTTDFPFTLQIGDPNTIAAETGITTIADFRRKDIALGGQGAPLVPAFHQQLFASQEDDRAVVNIGGISNVTILPKHGKSILGFDTGPGNTLLDSWIFKTKQVNYDANGYWAKSGNIIPTLIDHLLTDPYFSLPPPKSSGREYFNLEWLHKYISEEDFAPNAVDIQATLTDLTALTIINAIKQHMTNGEIILCGGGTHNEFLIERLEVAAHPDFSVATTAAYGIDPDWIEAVAFAWLAKQTLHKQPGNLPSVTGASTASILGGVYYS